MPQVKSSKLSSALKKRFSISRNTFIGAPKTDPRDRIDVEVGDSKQDDFLPQVKFCRWSNEVNFSVRAEAHPDAVVETEGEKIKYIAPDYEVHQYEKPRVSEDGGFEFEWVLPKRPASNVLRTTIQSKNLDFFYQGELTAEEIAEGSVRPDNIVGSYAVYHKAKPATFENGPEYRSGKAFHIYRPEAVDALGRKAWCELAVDAAKGVLTVTVPQEFLDRAVYPVTIDPTFGYTTADGTQFAGYNNGTIAIGNMVSQATASSGQAVTGYSFYGDAASSSFDGDINFATYTVSGGVPNARAGSVLNATGLISVGAASWHNSGTVSISLTNGTTYCVAISGGTFGINLYYDSGSAPGRINSTSVTLDDPFSDDGNGDSGRHYSWYATYGSSNTTTTKTITGKARIQKSTSQTVTGKARVQVTTSKTQTGKSRVQVSTARTQTGLARVQVSTPQTTTGKARIQATTLRTIAGVARILNTILKTITGKASIAITTLQTITGRARMQASTAQTTTGKSRIQVSTSQTQTGKSRVTVATLQTIAGVARIAVTTLKTIAGVARIQVSTAQTQTGKARVQGITSRTQTGLARIQATTLRTIAGLARITATTLQTITGRSRVQGTTLQTTTGKARVQVSTPQTQTGKSRIQVTTPQTISGLARILVTTAQAITGVAKIITTGSTQQTITGKARVQATTSRTTTGLARVQTTASKTLLGVARIINTISQTISGRARVQVTTQKTQTGLARIQGLSTQRTTQGRSRIQVTTSQSITGRARIVAALVANVPAELRLRGSLVTELEILGSLQTELRIVGAEQTVLTLEAEIS